MVLKMYSLLKSLFRGHSFVFGVMPYDILSNHRMATGHFGAFVTLKVILQVTGMVSSCDLQALGFKKVTVAESPGGVIPLL